MAETGGRGMTNADALRMTINKMSDNALARFIRSIRNRLFWRVSTREIY